MSLILFIFCILCPNDQFFEFFKRLTVCLNPKFWLFCDSIIISVHVNNPSVVSKLQLTW